MTSPDDTAALLDQYEAGDGSDNAKCRICRDWGTVIERGGGREVICPAPGCEIAARRARSVCVPPNCPPRPADLPQGDASPIVRPYVAGL